MTTSGIKIEIVKPEDHLLIALQKKEVQQPKNQSNASFPNQKSIRHLPINV
ncbi:MAG TPA: hypothetical protein VF350_08580 [Candidatus Bathyarchaeia archaeon]